MWIDVGLPAEPRFINLTQAREVLVKFAADAEEEEIPAMGGETPDPNSSSGPFKAFQAVAIVPRGEEEEEVVLKTFKVRGTGRTAHNTAADKAAEYVRAVMSKLPNVNMPVATKA